jgi:CTP synthase (UTP-ammonia lyase)
LKIPDADSAEHASPSRNIVISPVSCALPNRQQGAPKLSGSGELFLVPGTRLADIYSSTETHEEYFCNYEVNPAYVGRFQDAGLLVSAWGDKQAVRAVELRGKHFFVATLFQPQLSSTVDAPHPLVLAYLRAAAEFRQINSAATASQVARAHP